MGFEFLLGVAQTTIGTGIGFLFGIFAFHYQQRRQSDAKQEGEYRAALDALHRLNIAAMSNIEALANAKLQLINCMKPEVEQMKTAADNVYDAPQEELADKVSILETLSVSMRYFYQSLPSTSVMPQPEFVEYSELSKEMPALSQFVHRADGMMQQLNERIVSRNALIAEHAREGAVVGGMPAERLMYFSSMLADEGTAIYMHADDAMYIWGLVMEQIKLYLTVKAENEQFADYKLIPQAAEEMPKDELFPLMRDQLVKFDT